jgi:hypothetical protein
MLHNEGTVTRNWPSYNFQVLRDDVYILGKEGSVIGGRIAPFRSSSAVVVSSEDSLRQKIYSQLEASIYIADGAGGSRVFDIAQVHQKAFSQKITTAPLRQSTNVKTK